MKNVLMISFFAPPANAVATHRIAGFARFLTEFGWKPTLLTAKPQYYQAIDNELLSVIPPEVQIYRTDMIGRKYSHSGTPAGNLQKKPSLIKKCLVPAIKTVIRHIAFPDEYVGWVPYACKETQRILAKGQWDAIYTTGGPFSSMEIGYRLKKHTRLPWVVDFRDPWAHNPYWKGPHYHQKLNERLESKTVNACDRVIVTTQSIEKLYRDCYPAIPAEKFVTITNGYDPDLFENLNIAETSGNKFILTHAGWFYGPRKPDYLLKALRLMLDTHPEIPPSDILVRFIGNIPPELSILIAQLGLQNNIELAGVISHKQTLSYLKQSSVLVLIGGSEEKNEHLFIPAKLFEYMLTQRPILGLVNPGEATEIIRKGNMGESVLPTNIPGISDKIYKMYVAHKNNQNVYHPDKEFISRFNRRELSRQLAAEFTKLCP
ncbi:MAG: hypothetical protein A4E26_00088 [Methanobacterium sp. PtaU1.Bin097]|nr:MAG: hypothetical protein A4E26_00088 [Methanobacterium sp. PtaU1.Bin097]